MSEFLSLPKLRHIKQASRIFQQWTPEYFAKRLPFASVNLYQFLIGPQGRKRISLPNTPMKKAIDLIINNQDPNIRYYIVRDSLSETHTELLPEIDLPSWLGNSNTHEINLWLGQKDNITPMHFDTTDNYLVQIYGQKSAILFPVNAGKLLGYNSIKSGGRMNFCRLTDFKGLSDIEKENLNKLPHYEFTLNPGDALFIPKGWWHNVYTDSVSISLNYFLREADQSQYSCTWRLLRIQAFRLIEFSFKAEIRTAVNQAQYDNLYTTAKILFENAYFWLAALVCGVWFESYINSFISLSDNKFWQIGWPIENSISEQIAKSLKLTPNQLKEFLYQIALAYQENDELIDPKLLYEIIACIK